MLFVCFFRFSAIVEQYGIASGTMQVWMGFALVLIILEGTRRMVRPALPIISSVFLLYALYGHLIPGQFGHPPYTLTTLSSMFYLTTGGIWGQLLGVSADIIAIFVCLGAFIVHTGGGTGFMKIAIRLAGKYTGGPRKSGRDCQCAVRIGFRQRQCQCGFNWRVYHPDDETPGIFPALAAAVEAVASTGGQIMPPIMGAGAFIMAELIQTPYLKTRPARSFRNALFSHSRHGYSFLRAASGISRFISQRNSGLAQYSQSQRILFHPLCDAGNLVNTWIYTAICRFLGNRKHAAACVFHRDLEPGVSQQLQAYRTSGLTGARQAALIASICASAQIIIAIIAFTGIGVKVSSSILSLSQNSLFLALVLTGVTSLLLGMEVPTTAAYTVAVVVGGPVLENLGLPPLAAHLFVFYLAILSAVTPPVCGAIFIAAGMAEADWVETAKFGLKLSFAAFILPFLFVYNPSLILLGTPLRTILHVIRASLALLFISAGFMGYWKTICSLKIRSLLLLAGGLLCIPNLWTSLIGGCLGLGLWFRSSGMREQN